MMATNINGYKVNSFDLIQDATTPAKFMIQIEFEHNFEGRNGILITYHMMCAMLVVIASINFLIDPKVVPGRAGLLVTLFLVMTGFFSDAQVTLILEKLHLPKHYKALIV